MSIRRPVASACRCLAFQRSCCGRAKPSRGRSASAVLHVIQGEGEAEVDGVTLGFADSDTVAMPTYAKVLLANRSSKSPAFLFQIDDAPLQRKCGFYEEFN